MYKLIISTLKKNENKILAKDMSAYMRGQFEYFGIKSPLRKELSKPIFAEAKKLHREETIALCKELWNDPHRECHYIAQEILDRNMKKKWEKKDIEFLEWLVLHNSWWDTIDFIAPKLMAAYFKLYPETRKKRVEEWIKSGNTWLIRSAILIQLKTKKDTDFELLFDTILKVCNTKEFFINKAIGWVLRENAKHNEKIILDFVKKHKKSLSNLSVKEALKQYPELI